MAHAPYTIEEDFDATTFTVNPERFDVGGWIGLTFQALLCLGLLTMCSSMATGASYGSKEFAWSMFFIALALCAIGVYVPYRRVKKRHEANESARQQVKIHVCDEDIRTGNFKDPNQLIIPYKIFHRFVLKNSLDDSIVIAGGPGVIAGGTGITGAGLALTTGALAGAANMERAYRAKKHREEFAVSYQVVAEAQGIGYVLAQGMTEAGALGLMKDLCRHMDIRLGGSGKVCPA